MADEPSLGAPAALSYNNSTLYYVTVLIGAVFLLLSVPFGVMMLVGSVFLVGASPYAGRTFSPLQFIPILFPILFFLVGAYLLFATVLLTISIDPSRRKIRFTEKRALTLLTKSDVELDWGMVSAIHTDLILVQRRHSRGPAPLTAFLLSDGSRKEVGRLLDEEKAKAVAALIGCRYEFVDKTGNENSI